MTAPPLPPPSSEPASPFEYPPFEALYSCALHDVADRRLDSRERKAAARAITFLLREDPCERIVTDVLTAIHRSLDLANVVRTLLVGLRDALGDHERITTWARRIVGLAHSQRHVETFLSAARILVNLRDFDGALPASWQLSLIRASEDPRLQRRLVLLGDDYARRFGSEPTWITTVRARYIAKASGAGEVRTEAGGDET